MSPGVPIQPSTTKVETPKATSKSSETISGNVVPSRHLVGYKWAAPNSCFWDAPLEVLFQAFSGLSHQDRHALVAASGIKGSISSTPVDGRLLIGSLSF